MKTVIVALLVVLVVSHSEALRCNCAGKAPCAFSQQNCYGLNQVCARMTFNPPGSGSFKSCYNARACANLISSGKASGRCCSSDLCN
ncbi:hypothetical protein JOB18_019486 [Solea senegalensis]|uniref:Uncharacterized protein n=1 Tax=Solea senegalensis TaxID=28829 RepID=A0AAV6RQ69_SOLSE|nr:hypothetical protein JOB18_019486 [Solea senegalensis]